MKLWIFFLLPLCLILQQKPAFYFHINPQKTTYSQQVILHLETKHDTSDVFIRIWNENDFHLSKWQKFQPEINWKVSKGNGIKNISIKFKHKALSLGKTITQQVRYQKRGK